MGADDILDAQRDAGQGGRITLGDASIGLGRLRESAFGKEARDYGLPAPKGIALIGIPGTGKSLTAKMVANLWQLPLLRLDIGALFGGLVGQSEENCRQALQITETVSPCVLWIDEIEKGMSTGDNDGGTSMRVLGTMLSWMQEKSRPVFVVATANDVERLPPELLRKGRFDEVFFLDLPTEEERLEIFEVHVKKRRRDPAAYDLDGVQRVGNPNMRYDHVSLGLRARQRITSNMWFGFDVERTERTDQYVGYNDYTRDSFGAEFHWNIGDRFDLEASGVYRLYDYPNAFAFHNPAAARKTQESLDANFEASYRFTRNLSVFAEVRHREVVSNDIRVQYDRTGYALGVRWEQ